METKKVSFREYFNLENFSFIGMQSFYWIGFCVMFAYIGPYILSLGCTNTQLGLIISLNSIASVIGQPIYGFIADKIGSVKKVMLTSFIVGVILSLGFFVIGDNYIGLLILTTIVAFDVQAVYPIIDSWTVINERKDPRTSYSFTRPFGSLAYAICAGVIGGFLAAYGYHWIFIIFIATMILCAICAIPPRDTQPEAEEKLTLASIKALFQNKVYIEFVIISTLLYIAYKSTTGFLPVLMDNVGGTTAQLGYAWSILGFSEIPMFAFTGVLLKKFKDSHLLAFSILMFIPRTLVPSLCSTPEGIIASTLLHGLAYGIFLPASVSFIARVVDDKLSNTAQTFAVAMYAGVGISVSGIVGGMIADAYSIVTLYRLAAAIVAVMAIWFVISVVKNDRQEKES